MDAIAADAGVSKLTVYSHFGDKDSLFREVIRSRIQDLLPEETYRFDPQADIRETLLRVALTHAHLDCNAETVGTFRAILSDCRQGRSEEHTSELQSLMRISYAVFCLKKKKKKISTSN